MQSGQSGNQRNQTTHRRDGRRLGTVFLVRFHHNRAALRQIHAQDNMLQKAISQSTTAMDVLCLCVLLPFRFTNFSRFHPTITPMCGSFLSASPPLDNQFFQSRHFHFGKRQQFYVSLSFCWSSSSFVGSGIAAPRMERERSTCLS